MQKPGKYLEWELTQGYNKFQDLQEALNRNGQQSNQVPGLIHTPASPMLVQAGNHWLRWVCGCARAL